MQASKQRPALTHTWMLRKFSALLQSMTDPKRVAEAPTLNIPPGQGRQRPTDMPLQRLGSRSQDSMCKENARRTLLPSHKVRPRIRCGPDEAVLERGADQVSLCSPRLRRRPVHANWVQRPTPHRGSPGRSRSHRPLKFSNFIKPCEDETIKDKMDLPLGGVVS